jgi:hypothetical protein
MYHTVRYNASAWTANQAFFFFGGGSTGGGGTIRNINIPGPSALRIVSIRLSSWII